MGKKQHTLASAMRRCTQAGLQVDVTAKVISRTKPKSDVGNGTLGVLDFLRKEHGYVYVNEVPRHKEDWAV